jgi:hypothetical protein
MFCSPSHIAENINFDNYGKLKLPVKHNHKSIEYFNNNHGLMLITVEIFSGYIEAKKRPCEERVGRRRCRAWGKYFQLATSKTGKPLFSKPVSLFLYINKIYSTVRYRTERDDYLMDYVKLMMALELVSSNKTEVTTEPILEASYYECVTQFF